MKGRYRFLLLGMLAALVLAASAAARPDRFASQEMFPGEGVAEEEQQGMTEGHLLPISQGVKFVGKAEVTKPAGSGNDGRIADVSAFGKFAFLTAFREPTCERTGAHVIDMSDPKNPFEVTSAFMETTPFNYAGEGSDTLRLKNEFFDGVLFIHQNETCPGAPEPTAPATRGGINIWDVTDPRNPELLVKHAGDFTNPAGGMDDQPNQTHSVFAWTSPFDGRTYAVLVDDEEFTDLDIMDITDPRNPFLVNDTLDLVELFGVEQESPPNLTSIFSHDMYVKRVGQRLVMNVSYWDGGYVLLDVTDPTPGNVTLIAESDFEELDPERLARGHEISPEGNAHQSELSRNNRWLVAGDEDFNAYRVVAEITSGPHSGTEFTAISGSGVPPIDPDTTISGTPTFVGLACAASPPPAGDGVALIERGVCSFQEKLDTVKAAGYDAGIVFNTVRPDCQGLVFMLAEGDIPFVFVDRATGLQLLNQTLSADVCTQASPAEGSPVSSVLIEAVFDGWGYVRLFKTQVPGQVGAPGSIELVDTFAIPESQDPAFAEGFGDLSVHEVALNPNPNRNLAYVSYYAGGFRILKYGPGGLRQVGVFIDEGGNNFWGVEFHKMGGRGYVLASDRDFGLYIFRP